MLTSSNSENDFVSEPLATPSDPSQFKVGDRVNFGMSWIGGRVVTVHGKIEAIEGPNALLSTLGFFESPGDSGIEPLANLRLNDEDEEKYLASFDDPNTPEPLEGDATSDYTNQDPDLKNR
jgi:hypothetical protein